MPVTPSPPLGCPWEEAPPPSLFPRFRALLLASERRGSERNIYIYIYTIHIYIYTHTHTHICVPILSEEGAVGEGEIFLCALLLLLLLILASLSVREFLSVSEKGNEILGLASFEYYKYYT